MRLERVGYVDILAHLAGLSGFPASERERLDLALTTEVDEEREHLTRELLERLAVLGLLTVTRAADPRPSGETVERLVYRTIDRLQRFIIPATSAAAAAPLQMLPRPVSLP